MCKKLIIYISTTFIINT